MGNENWGPRGRACRRWVLVGVGVLAAAVVGCGHPEDGDGPGANGGGGADGGDGVRMQGIPGDCDGSVEAPETRFVVDACGRVLVLRGTNVEESAKGTSQDDPHLPASSIRSHDDMGKFGWNAVRFLIFWGAVEPEQGEYDQRYLDDVEVWLDAYAERGVHVVLDMHQDIYGWAAGGDGAPDWAVFTDGLEAQPLPPGLPWFLGAADPAAQAAYQNFWDTSRGHADLREHFLATWEHVATRFADHPAVIGYDLLNSPVFANGDLEATLAIQAEAAAGDYRNTNLTEFSQQAIDSIRSADDDAWIMVEPTSIVNTFPYPGDLVENELTDPRDGPPRLAYAPHLYEQRDAASSYVPNSPYLGLWEQYRTDEASEMDAVLFIGEFGGAADNGRMDEYIDRVLAMADHNMVGWAQWSWDPEPPGAPAGSWSPITTTGELTANGERLARVQPRAVAGVPTGFTWDPATNVFRMAWEAREDVDAPTELGVPLGAWDGEVEVVLDGEVVDSGDVEIDEERGVLTLPTPSDRSDHDVCVRWGAGAGPC